VKKKHNIDLNITYDSSGIYKQVMHARFMHVPDQHGNIMKMNIKSNNLDKRFVVSNDTIITEMYQTIMDKVAEKWQFRKIMVDGVYDENTKTFHEDVKSYSILYTLDLYAEIQQLMREFAARVYPIYESGELDEFYQECFNITSRLNQGKLTKKQRIKSYSIPRSLDMLSNLDESHCKWLVDKFLAKDEFRDLDETTEILKI
jgi:hypothetical protein